MNKKLFFAGFALLAAVSFTSCNSDNPIDVTDPNGVRPVNSAHYLGGSYDWTAVVKDYAQLQEFWAADKDAVKKALTDSKANKVNILLDVSGYELKNEVITLPNFWGAGADTNGKVVNITFQGNFKNADFERANAIAKNDVIANMSKFPVKVNTDNLKSAEVNFTFNVEKFDLVLDTRYARSTFAGAYTIGYMKAVADVKTQDAIEVKEGTVEGVDVESTGNFKGVFDGVWTKSALNFIEVAANGIKTTQVTGDVIPGSKNVYVEDQAYIDTWYRSGGKDVQYKLGTVKFVQNAANTVKLDLWGRKGSPKSATAVTEDAIEKIQGFNKGKCQVATQNQANALKNIDAMEKVSVLGSATLKKDIFTDVEFKGNVEFKTGDIATFENVTFNNVTMKVDADDQTLTFKNVNFWQPVDIKSDIYIGEIVKTTVTQYQWIVDAANPTTGRFQEVTGAAPLTEANKTKEVKKYNYDNVRFNGANFSPVNASSDAAAANEANSSYVVEITRNYKKGETYIPVGTNVVLDENCKFSDLGGTVGVPELQTSNYALNLIWGNKQLWDEQCWYAVNYAGDDYNWKKISKAGTTGGVLFVLTKAAAAE